MRSILPGLLPCLVAGALGASAAETAPTFYKDVLPVLQDHCQSCHRPGEIGPMPLLTYQQVRPYAAAIREAIETKRMPPWGAESAKLRFANDPSLSDKDRQTILNWANAKAPEGDAKDAPAPRAFPEGWNIGQPDVVFEMPQPYDVPATGVVEYTYIVLPTHFTQDKWVQAAEIRPTARRVVHHVIAYIRPPDSDWLADAKPGIPYVPKQALDKRTDGGGQFLIGYAPGSTPQRLAPSQGKLIKAGSDVVLEVHYTTDGKPITDQTKVGIIFAKQTPTERVLTIGPLNGDFVIPPGDAKYPVTADESFYGDGKIVGFFPHMHVRGKSFRYELVQRDGARTTLLDVPRYDFHWQQNYKPTQPVAVHSGSKIECFAVYDNSPENPWNPDPGKPVKWGDQSWEEMMVGFMEIAIPVKTDPVDVLVDPKDRAHETAQK